MGSKLAILGIVVVALAALYVVRARSFISSEQARQMVADGAALLDVRTREEFSGGHIQGAVNIPVQDLSTRLHELDKQTPIVVYCRSGARSASAKSLLESQGFAKVENLGGMSRW